MPTRLSSHQAREIIKQWVDVHGLSDAPSKELRVEDYPRQVWLNDAGDELVESYTITHMAHGTPLATGEADFECGAAGPFLLEVGISSSFHIAKFFGLTAAGARSVSPGDPDFKAAALLSFGKIAKPGQAQILHREAVEDAETAARPRPTFSRIDIGAVITKALETAGLINRG